MCKMGLMVAPAPQMCPEIKSDKSPGCFHLVTDWSQCSFLPSFRCDHEPRCGLQVLWQAWRPQPWWRPSQHLYSDKPMRDRGDARDSSLEQMPREGGREEAPGKGNHRQRGRQYHALRQGGMPTVMVRVSWGCCNKAQVGGF